MADPSAQDLPLAFLQARDADEAFWRAQERSIQGAMGQPCCTLAGISTGLIAMDGDFAVIIHGEDECASCFYHQGVSAHRFYCTGLTEHQFVSGETSAPLRECLTRVAEETAPEAIFVLGACPIEVIGDRFETVVDEVQQRFPHIPMAAMHTSGLRVGSQSAMLDWMFSTLAALPARPPTDRRWSEKVRRAGIDAVNASYRSSGVSEELTRRLTEALERPEVPAPERSINLLGLPQRHSSRESRPEWEDVLTQAGLHIVGNFPYAANLDTWRSMTWAKATFVADRSLYPKLVKVLEDAGQQVHQVPLPVGIEQTTRFYETIASAYDLGDEFRDAIRVHREAAEAPLRVFRERFGHLRVAMGLRMVNNYQTDQLAYQGFGDYAPMAEMGFDITLMVQGPPEKKAKFARMFEAHGITHPFEMFPDPWTLSDHLDSERFDVAYMADHCRVEVSKAGLPMIVSRQLAPFYEGVARNCVVMTQMMERALASRPS